MRREDLEHVVRSAGVRSGPVEHAWWLTPRGEELVRGFGE